MTRTRRRKNESGFALLLVFLMAGTIAIFLYMQLPRAAFESQRNREELLIERGEQYTRAIQLYVSQIKKFPQSIDDLESTNGKRFLRHRYKDPMTGKDEWRLIHVNGAGILTDSLVQKPPAAGEKKTEYANTFITENAAIGSTGTVQNAGGGNSAAMRRRPSDGDPNNPQQFDPNNPQAQQQIVPGMIGQPAGGPQYLPGQINPGQVNPGQINPGQINPGQINPVQANPGQGNPGQNQDPNAPPRPNYGQFDPNIPQATGYPTGVATQQGRQQGGMPTGLFGAIPPGGPTGGANPGVPGVPDAVRAAIFGPRPGGSPIPSAFGTGQIGGGIAGVASTLEADSIKIYNDRQKYNEWEFVYDMKKDKRIMGAAAGAVPNPIVNPLNPNQNGPQNNPGTNPGSGFNSAPSTFGPGGFGSTPPPPPPRRPF